jgi:S1-C subfamily serine protease
MSAVGLGEKYGLLTIAVPQNIAAAKAGLKENNVLRNVNAEAIRNLAEFVALWDKQKTGSDVTLKIWRDQANATVTVQKP